MQSKKAIIMKIKASFLMLSILFVGYSLISCGQNKSERPSPPATVKGEINGVSVEINYSQPAVKGREIWGELVPYDKVWRTGANEASTITISENVIINGKELKAGKYGLFTIPSTDKWTVIFNEVWDQWGAYQYDESKDALRVSVTPSKLTENQERLVFAVTNQAVEMKWEKLLISIPISK